MAVAYAAGGALGLLTDTLLSDSSSRAVAAMSLLSLLGALVLVVLARTRPSEGLLTAAVAMAVVLVSVALADTEEVAANAIFYLLPASFAAYCLPTRGLVLVMGMIAAGFAIVLGLPTRGLGGLDHWVMTIGCLWVMTALLVRLRRCIDRLVGELEHASETDPLTGVLNRRGFEQRLAQQLPEHARRGAPLGLLIVDVDNFKLTNDRLGHAGGDDVLRLVAGALGRSARAGDVVARVGGEEFAVLLPDTDAAFAETCAERLRGAVAEASSGSTTVSVGAGITATAGEDSDGLLRRADEAMYAAKQAGRNRVAVGG